MQQHYIIFLTLLKSKYQDAYESYLEITFHLSVYLHNLVPFKFIDIFICDYCEHLFLLLKSYFVERNE